MSEMESDDGASKMRNESELVSWIHEFKSQLEPNQRKTVYETLKVNGFTTRLKLKLVTQDELNIMFPNTNEGLPLGAKRLLSYQLDVLRDQSPLVVKSSKKLYRQDQEHENTKADSKKKVISKLFVTIRAFVRSLLSYV